jgi:2',3'-cyclic-nucleotide 2'-phosphodiesterase (5'-nucleotidase family)
MKRIVLLFLLIITACSNTNNVAVSPTPTVTATFTATPKPSETPTPIPPPTSTPTVIATLPPATPGKPVTITVLTTNDLHIMFNSYVDMIAPSLLHISAFVAQKRKEQGSENIMMLDGGDVMMLYNSDPSHAFAADQVLKTIGYDAVAIGNHEWDWGKKTLIERVKATGSMYLAVNLTKRNLDGTCTWEPFFSGYRIFERGQADNRVRIAVIGVTSYAVNEPDVCWQKPLEAIVHLYNATPELKNVDAVIVITHQGFADNLSGGETLAKGLSEAGIPLHLVVGGHTHKLESEVVGQTLLTQSGGNGEYIGVITMMIDRYTHQVSSTWNYERFTESSPIDTTLLELIKSLIVK